MRLKVCGITREEDAQRAAQLGYQYCGFIFHPDSPRHVTMEQAAAIDSGPLLRVGVFVQQGPVEIRAIMREARLHLAQLHGEQTAEEALAIGADQVIRVLWPERYATVEALEADASHQPCAFFLLDGGEEGGGGGLPLTWERLRTLRLPKGFFLAGGLGPHNVAEALEHCSPAGMDLNSGVESAPGIKDHNKMAAVAATLRGK